LTVANLSAQFGLQSLIGKSLAVIPDARFGKRTDLAVVAERLLSISGEDAVGISRKFLPDWIGQLAVRFLLMTNELPNLADSSGALVERFIVLTLTKSFLGREDPLLFDRLKAELPGILNWAIEGYHRLHSRGHFQQPQSSLDTIRALKEISSPVMAFVEDECQVGPNLSVSKKRLFEQWNVWRVQNGYRSGDQQAFGRELRAAFPVIGDARPSGGSRQRLYTGIGLRSDGLAVIEGGRAQPNEAQDA
jgi:putative DNA primase/helicase